MKLLDFGIAKLLDADTDEGTTTLTDVGFGALTPSGTTALARLHTGLLPA